MDPYCLHEFPPLLKRSVATVVKNHPNYVVISLLDYEGRQFSNMVLFKVPIGCELGETGHLTKFMMGVGKTVWVEGFNEE